MAQVRIGVVGYCPPTKYDEEIALKNLEEAFDKLRVDFPDREVVIVSGATNVGILAQAYALATQRGFKTGGVACEKAVNFELYPMTEQPIIVGANWGAESSVFINGIGAIAQVASDKVEQYKHHPHYGLDAMIRIGVGPQSIRETQMIKGMGKPTYEYDLPRLG